MKINLIQRFKYGNKINLSGLKLNKNKFLQFVQKVNFTEKNDEDSHSDFKTKSKIEINDSNVEIIEKMDTK